MHTKSRVVQMAHEQGKDANQLDAEIMTNLKADNKQLTPYELSEYIDFSNFTEDDIKFGERNGKLNAVPIAFNTYTLYYNQSNRPKYNQNKLFPALLSFGFFFYFQGSFQIPQ